MSGDALTSVMTCDVCGGLPCINPSFCRVSRRADEKARLPATDPTILRARRLLDDSVSLAPAYAELNSNRPTLEATIEALMFSLHRGVNELTQPDTQRRLSELNKDQLEAVCLRVQAFEPNIVPAWSADDADLLISAWRKFREQR